MANRLEKAFEKHKIKAEKIFLQKAKVLDYLDEAFKKLARKSPRAQRLFKDLSDFILLIKYWIQGKYSQLSYPSALMIFGAILYFLNPFDLIPDVIPVLGFTDDAAVLALVLKSVGSELENFRKWKGEVRTN